MMHLQKLYFAQAHCSVIVHDCGHRVSNINCSSYVTLFEGTQGFVNRPSTMQPASLFIYSYQVMYFFGRPSLLKDARIDKFVFLIWLSTEKWF